MQCHYTFSPPEILYFIYHHTICLQQEHEDQKLKEILRDDFIDDSDDGLGQFGDDDDLLPVQLPMVNTGRGFKEEEDKELKPHIPVKREEVSGWLGLVRLSEFNISQVQSSVSS